MLNKNYKHKWIENFVVDDPMHLLRDKKNESYISYQLVRLFLFFKHLFYGKPKFKKDD